MPPLHAPHDQTTTLHSPPRKQNLGRPRARLPSMSLEQHRHRDPIGPPGCAAVEGIPFPCRAARDGTGVDKFRIRSDSNPNYADMEKSF
jgi:hypothetical protein